MKDNMLRFIISRFDEFVKDIDFQHLPDEDSEEYRTLILQTADQQIYRDGRYSDITEGTMEFFNDEEEEHKAVTDLLLINDLTDSERQRLRFYLDLKAVCHPLFQGQKVDWTLWPWNMDDDSDSMENKPLRQFIIEGTYCNLSAAICYDLMRQVWDNEEFYSSVARNEVAHAFNYGVKELWKRGKSGKGQQRLMDAVENFIDVLWAVENHMLIGRRLGFDLVAQSVYDALDTFIDSTYRNRQVDFALEVGQWINQNWTMGEEHPSQEKMRALDDVMTQAMAKHDVCTADFEYTWNIITLDLLGVALGDTSSNQETDD